MPIDHGAIAAAAARQHGAFSLAQAVEAGASPRAIRTAIESGRWTRPTRGVYLLAGRADSLAQRAMVATLARPEGVIGWLTAAHLGSWVPSSPRRPILVVPPGTSIRLPIATVRRSVVHPGERAIVQGIATTAPARTLVDLAHELGPTPLARVVDAAMHAGACTVTAVAEQLARTPHLSTERARALLRALEPWREAIRPGSPAEARLVRLVVAWGYPPPELQVAIVDDHGQVVARADGGWPTTRIAFEYDGAAFHGPERWAADEARHRRIEQLGWRLLRADAADLRPGERSFRDALARAWAERSGRAVRANVR